MDGGFGEGLAVVKGGRMRVERERERRVRRVVFIAGRWCFLDLLLVVVI